MSVHITGGDHDPLTCDTCFNPQPKPSPRAVAQHLLVAYLNEHSRFWNAPYGVLPGMADLPKGGKVRNVTFGIARWLDAHATFWSPTRIVIEGQGALASKVEGTYDSVDAVIARLEAVSNG